MAYTVTAVTIRTDNTPEGISPISRYSAYESDESGAYDLSVLAVRSDFFIRMEQAVAAGLYKKYETATDDGAVESCTRQAWTQVWNETQKKTISRAFTEDFESTVPAQYTKDGRAHCYLYIAVKS